MNSGKKTIKIRFFFIFFPSSFFSNIAVERKRKSIYYITSQASLLSLSLTQKYTLLSVVVVVFSTVGFSILIIKWTNKQKNERIWITGIIIIKKKFNLCAAFFSSKSLLYANIFHIVMSSPLVAVVVVDFINFFLGICFNLVLWIQKRQ